MTPSPPTSSNPKAMRKRFSGEAVTSLGFLTRGRYTGGEGPRGAGLKKNRVMVFPTFSVKGNVRDVYIFTYFMLYDMYLL